MTYRRILKTVMLAVGVLAFVIIMIILVINANRNIPCYEDLEFTSGKLSASNPIFSGGGRAREVKDMIDSQPV